MPLNNKLKDKILLYDHLSFAVTVKNGRGIFVKNYICIYVCVCAHICLSVCVYIYVCT